MSSSTPASVPSAPITVGSYIANCIATLGISKVFTVAGDFNVKLLTAILEFNKHTPKYDLIYCCNELNTGYACDGYARVKGLGAMIVTYSVGTLSCVNAAAGMYNEHIPCLIFSGGPNNNSYLNSQLVHHTLGERLNASDYVMETMSKVTAKQVNITNAEDAPICLYDAICACLTKQRPVYIQISCNIINEPIVRHAKPGRMIPPFPSFHSLNWTTQKSYSDPEILHLGLNYITEKLTQAKKPCFVIGSCIKLLFQDSERDLRAELETFIRMNGIALVQMPDAKGMLSEGHSNFVGTGWGGVSVPRCTHDFMEQADYIVTIGGKFTDYCTAGFTLATDPSKTSFIQPNHFILDQYPYLNVNMLTLMKKLLSHGKFGTPEQIEERNKSWVAPLKAQFIEQMDLISGIKSFDPESPNQQQLAEKQGAINEQLNQYYVHMIDTPPCAGKVDGESRTQLTTMMTKYGLDVKPEARITVQSLLYFVQKWLIYDFPSTRQHFHLMTESGDSWIHGQKLHYNQGGVFTLIQMHYGSIGWAVGATVGAQQALMTLSKEATEPVNHRLITFTGDGALQMSVQEFSTMIRYGCNNIVFIMNNHGYVIEELIETGSFNQIANWDYTRLVESFQSQPDAGYEKISYETVRPSPVYAVKIRTVHDLSVALKEALARSTSLCILEIMLDCQDFNPELKIWAKLMAGISSRATPNLDYR